MNQEKAIKPIALPAIDKDRAEQIEMAQRRGFTEIREDRGYLRGWRTITPGLQQLQWLPTVAQMKAFEAMEVHTMTDQPPTCPKCGVRVDIIHGAEGSKQIVRCSPCKFTYRLEAE